LTAAVQLASILMLFVLLLLGVERFSRSSRVVQSERRPTGHRMRLDGARGWLATALQLLVVLVGVLLPLIQLLAWAWPQLSELLDARLVGVVFNTMLLGLSGALAVVFGGILVLAATYRTSRRQQLLGELAALGYAIPGTVLAVAIMLAFLRF